MNLCECHWARRWVGSLTQTQACRPCPDHTWLLESPLDTSWSKWPKPRRKDAKSSSNVSCLQDTKNKWFHSKSLTHSADNFKTSEGHDCPSRINALHSLLPDPGGWALFIAPSPCMTEATKAVYLVDHPLFSPPSPCPWSFPLIFPTWLFWITDTIFPTSFSPLCLALLAHSPGMLLWCESPYSIQGALWGTSLTAYLPPLHLPKSNICWNPELQRRKSMLKLYLRNV